LTEEGPGFSLLVTDCHRPEDGQVHISFISGWLDVGQQWHDPCLYITRDKQKEDTEMITLWIVLGCMFMTGIGIRFTYRVLGLTPAEATAVFILVVTLVGINTAPAREILMQLF